jgi:PHB/PHA accumulation regulator DNA-binding domain
MMSLADGDDPHCTAQIQGMTGLAFLAWRSHMVGMNTEPVLIKRYGGGRLYDTATLCYLSLDDLAELVARGERFIVRDAKTDNDVTLEILDRLH